jgi:hypothetical protein
MVGQMPPVSVAQPAPIRPIGLPTVSYGPFRLLEVVPWLMFATAIRFVSYGNGLRMLIGLVLESFALFVAFLVGTRRMIEFSDGRTDLGKLSFVQQIVLARRVLGYVVVLLILAALAMAAIGATDLAPHMFYGLDGVAFDQFTRAGRVWSSLLAALVLLMVVKLGTHQQITLRGTASEFFARSPFLMPAVVAVAAIQFGLAPVQHAARTAVYDFWHMSMATQAVKNLVYFGFVFGFASLRLWLTLAILTFALRESYRRG